MGSRNVTCWCFGLTLSMLSLPAQAFSSSLVPAESRRALVVVLAVGTVWFTVHDSPQRRHAGCSSQRLDPFNVHLLLWTQWTSTHLDTERLINQVHRITLVAFGLNQVVHASEKLLTLRDQLIDEIRCDMAKLKFIEG